VIILTAFGITGDVTLDTLFIIMARKLLLIIFQPEFFTVLSLLLALAASYTLSSFSAKSGNSKKQEYPLDDLYVLQGIHMLSHETMSVKMEERILSELQNEAMGPRIETNMRATE
jgi:hypothetical protein